jgi:hypothetical protein
MPAQKNSIRRSCDRCYRAKERCVFKPLASSCTLCERFSHTCAILRKQPRAGRRPQTQPPNSNGSFHVWEVTGASESSHIVSNPTNNTPGIPIQTVSNNQFDRLLVAEHSPQSDRIVLFKSISTLSTVEQIYELGIPVKELVRLQLTDLDLFYEINAIFMFGPGFARRYQAALRYSYECAPRCLEDMYTAVNSALIWVRRRDTTWEQIDVTRGTLCLQRLRTASVDKLQEAVAIMTLGHALAVYDVLTTCEGSILILRHTLALIKPWYETLSRDPKLDPITISPVWWDIVHCLLYQEVPIIQFTIRDPNVIDHLAGFCVTLIPIVYDLCIVNNKIQQGVLGDHTTILREIEERLSSWQPSSELESVNGFSSEEISAMRAQAFMNRTAALMIMHRIRNPIGAKDDIAKLYADSIVTELCQYLALVAPGKMLPHTSFPLFMAMIETTDFPREFRDNITLKKVIPVCSKLLAVVDFVWTKRLAGFTGSMFDLIKSGPDFVIIP